MRKAQWPVLQQFLRLSPAGHPTLPGIPYVSELQTQVLQVLSWVQGSWQPLSPRTWVTDTGPLKERPPNTRGH